MGRPKNDIAPGSTFGRLTVLASAGTVLTNRGIRCAGFRVRCDCGKELIAQGARLRAGDNISCGCAQHRGATRTHGRSKRGGAYKTWCEMRARCNNPRNVSYANYGGRGISVCERWGSFENFIADMGERPSGLSIDRIDVNGNYEPNNCRWATDCQQARNTRRTKLTEQIVREIKGRAEHGEAQRSIASRVGITQCTVSAVVRGAIWAGVE